MATLDPNEGMITWVKDLTNARYYDWALACLRNNPPCVDWLIAIEDNNPDASKQHDYP